MSTRHREPIQQAPQQDDKTSGKAPEKTSPAAQSPQKGQGQKSSKPTKSPKG
jgi:hypothetical protein